jgi:HAD superfamily hydrolase (TIGR01490 family)
MALALFDLDNTLIAGDSDHGWGEFLCRKGYVDAQAYKDRNNYYLNQYEEGLLDPYEYLEFALQPLTQNDAATLAGWHAEFMQETILPMLLPTAVDLLDAHRNRGDHIVVITSTNRFVVEPIVAALGGAHDILATEPELIDGRYTGKIVGEPCFREGKVRRMAQWLKDKPFSLDDAYFYSDSINDLPLLLEVSNPVVVDPDAALRQEAKQRDWLILSLR